MPPAMIVLNYWKQNPARWQMREALSVAMIASAAPESSLEHLQVKLADDTCISGGPTQHWE